MIRIILEEQDISIEELEKGLKQSSVEFRQKLYKNGDYENSFTDYGYYVFVSIKFDYKEDEINYANRCVRDLRSRMIIARIIDEDEYEDEYNRWTITIDKEQSHDIDTVEHFISLTYKQMKQKGILDYKYETGEFKEETKESDNFILIENTSDENSDIVTDILDKYELEYALWNTKLIEKIEKDIIPDEYGWINDEKDINETLVDQNKNLFGKIHPDLYKTIKLFDSEDPNIEQTNESDFSISKLKSSNNFRDDSCSSGLDLSILKLKTFDEFFANKLIGQDETLQKLKEQLITKTYDLDNSSTRPAGIFLFVGPTGVGKTEMCKVLSEFLYNNKNINRFDMSEYKSDVAIQKLIGAPNGYVGYEEGGTLINAMMKNPNSIVLFDEIEKADSHVFDLFLQMFDEGIITSNKGEKVCFKNNFIILTSNIGANLLTSKMTNDVSKQIIRDAVNDFFTYELNRPEIIGRVGKENIISFNPINKESDQFKILDIHFDKFIKQIEEKNIKVKFNKEHVYRMVLLDVDITKGARDIRNEFDQFKIHFNKALFENDLDWSKLAKKTITFDYDNAKVIIKGVK